MAPDSTGSDTGKTPGAAQASSSATAAPGTSGSEGVDTAVTLAPGAAAADPASPPTSGSGANTDPATPTASSPEATGAASTGGADPTVDSATQPGPFTVSTFTTGLRDGPDYGTQTLYVPSDAMPPLASVAIVPGFGAAEASIADWGPFLASHGIVALTIGTNTTSDSPDQRASALLDALETVKAENTRSGGPLEGKLATDRLGVMGWSMGGGGTLIASSKTPSLKAAITMAAWSPGVRFESEQVPTLLFAGSADPNAGGQSQGFFESIPASTPKLLFEVQGGPHTVANSPNGAGGAVGRYGLSWLEVFLVGDDRYRSLLLQQPSEASDFRQNLSAP
jgi:dienelactone hydrolase